eukprot:CAMPEP_0176431778 /NCGR_PEP_ID=MMETSP0127-20121128/15003_1 /TAXON_ID=938130 /ORGANISM="Platyophrya macrostoma, Strain WH" /LENGTH=100 /DNA_ID=CAMNT_0017813827 /DNA_START=51 /DNA_END=353 /DNA_ORIENTATION=-
MFGRPAAPQKDWSEMYFYQKVQHLVDHGADWILSKTKWWIPSVAVGMTVSVFLLSGPMAIPEAMNLVGPIVTPSLSAPLFGNQMPEREGMHGEDDEEEDA